MGFYPSSLVRLEKAPSFVALGSEAMTMVIDYQVLAKGSMPSSLPAARASKPMPVSAPQAPPAASTAMPAPSVSSVKIAPSQEDSILSPQEFQTPGRTDSGTPQLSTDELLNRKLDELREAREANKLKDSEIAMLKKETTWMKKELRQRTEEVKSLKASKTTSRSIPKKKSAEAYRTR